MRDYTVLRQQSFTLGRLGRLDPAIDSGPPMLRTVGYCLIIVFFFTGKEGLEVPEKEYGPAFSALSGHGIVENRTLSFVSASGLALL